MSVDNQPVYGIRDPLTTPQSIAWEMDTYGPWGVTIDLPHHQTHEGEMFSFVTASSDLDANDVHGVIIHTAAGAYPHLVFDVTASAAGRVDFYKAPNISASHNRGQALTAVNMNQNSSKTPSTTMRYHYTALATPGTLLDRFFIGGGGNRGAGAGESRSSNEWVLYGVAATHYYIKFTSAAANNEAAISCHVYEEGAD